ncbi:probable LRR receptor-like serine/threonine-protein kinase At5g59680 [Arabidopsis lyrata subsp. lyrata]|uniref:probable LRR receptor-like serine/threonine-protein kinase At5g59680 n=1 Tax=Arabidopsis lyrata subsp. lyrata TaxID=81972 RepID=UPI000A29BC8F|nr:probable LRR receptor-like serine/threonine-protein kinase At5g59680 [Arabidopsis lyrata subsp. lyrata]|eukprot:XP_020866210.1 probable LRR receptor-like serine/threonine-protein kinase At5g59680 [Arabidopsis lyrata subsp. lyrata]
MLLFIFFRYRAGVYGADVFDRIWQPYNLENWSQIRTNNSVDVYNEYRPPESAMITASVPTDPDAPMNISLTRVEPGSQFYVCLHFSEIQDLKSNETREFHIMYNGRIIVRAFRPRRLYTFSEVIDQEVGPNANGEYTFSFQRTLDSTLPPLLNAMEVYIMKPLGKQATDKTEVDAIDRIKSRWGREKIDWEGDPCVPHEYMWNGLKCKYKHNKHPRIVSLNLTASGLIGEIPDTLSNLTSLEVLDLSNNNLTGSVPEFLADMESLKFINLSCNELNGLIIPKRLLDRAQKGLVTLSVDEFPGVCSSPSHSTTSKKKTNIVVASTLFLILLIAAVIVFICKRKRIADRHPSSENNNLQQWDQSSFSDIAQNVFTYEDLAQATGNFSSTNLIGQGGFGYVHRGVTSDGTEVAIKQLKAGSRQGEQEFLAEIEIISRVHHKHLVSLLGYCITRCQRLLVYEFVPNKTLEFHLHEKEAPVMEWAKRMKIALGSAKGLSYLHDDCNPKTIHRDVKATNILIDNSYEPKLADFGLARSCSDTETHVSTRVMGTFGYLAPEYASSGKLTDKSDVFVSLLKE